MGAIPKADRQCQFSARAAQVRPLIARALADEFWFGNKPPGWPGAPTAADAKKARKRYIKRLRRFTPDFPEAKKLAKILARCKRRRRCMSGACPECGRAFQRWFVAEVKNLANNDESGTHRRQHCLPPPPRGGRQARHAQHDQDEAGRDRDHQERRRSRVDGWRHRPEPQRRHAEEAGYRLAAPILRVRRRSQPCSLCPRCCATHIAQPKECPGRSRSKNVMVRRGQFPTASRPSSSGVSPTEQKWAHPTTGGNVGTRARFPFAQSNTSERCFGCTGSVWPVVCSCEAFA